MRDNIIVLCCINNILEYCEPGFCNHFITQHLVRLCKICFNFFESVV